MHTYVTLHMYYQQYTSAPDLVNHCDLSEVI